MTHKDYELIAEALFINVVLFPGDSEYQRGFSDGAKDCVMDIAEVLAQDNPRFDREKFLKACGI